MADEKSRGRGVLNDRQRRYLRGEADIEPKSPDERSIRQAIRDNLRNAILDFPLILNELEDRDLDRTFHPDTPRRRWADEVTEAIPGMIGVAYLADEAVFQTRVSSGVSRAELRKGWDVDVDVSISVDRSTEIGQLAEELQRHGADADLSIQELNTLLAAGEIDRALYGEMMEDRVS